MGNEIVDSHQHFWQVGSFDYPWMPDEPSVLRRDYLPCDLRPLMERCGVSRTILVQASDSRLETVWMLKLANAHSFIAGVVGWVDLKNGNVTKQLDDFRRNSKLKGVRHIVEAEPADDWLVQESVVRSLREVASHGLTYDLLVHTRHL